jgi:cytochrome c-type biogenesis protein CcmE
MTETSTILRGTVRSNRANRNLKFIVGGVVVAGLIIYLMVNAVQSAGAYYREVHEVLAQESSLMGKPIRVSGNIVPGSIVYDAAKLDLSFKISDPSDANKMLAIHFHGVKPDQMEREGTSAIVEGTLGSNLSKVAATGTGAAAAGGGPQVEANNLLLKCPSRYEQYDQIKVNAVK